MVTIKRGWLAKATLFFMVLIEPLFLLYLM